MYFNSEVIIMRKGFILIIISCYLTQTIAKCPSNELILQCSCENDNNDSYLYCGGNDYYNLKDIFVSLSGALNENEKHFKQFYFNNTAINELEFNVFYDITFEIISIDSAYNLTQINTHAFLSTSYFVSRFHLWNTPYGNTISDDNNIYNALNAMTNIEYIYITNTSISSVPSNAFTVLNMLRLLIISHNRNLKSIGDNAFYDLNNLTQIFLSANPIDYISDNALRFRRRNTIILNIYISNMPNSFTSNSFSNVTFSSIRRQFILYLEYDLWLKYLNENIFSVALANHSEFRLSGTILECDCRMFWLYKNKAQYQQLVRNAICTDGDSVFADRPTYNDCDA